MKLTLRILTLVCYCLPFTFFVKTCVGPDMKPAYNQQQLEVNQREAANFEKRRHLLDSIAALGSDTLAPMQASVSAADSVHKDSSSRTAASSASVKEKNSNSMFTNAGWTMYQVWERIKRPTDSSLSGIGTIFDYKNPVGKLLIGLSFLISLIVLINSKRIRTKKWQETLLIVNIVLLITYLVVSLLSSVSLRWGFWLLLILLFAQLYREVVNAGTSEE